MHVVAIHHTSPTDGSRAQDLARILGLTAFDVRHRVLSEGPCVVGSFPDVADARALATRLDAAGFSTLVRDADRIESADIWTAVRSFRVEGDGVEFAPRSSDPYHVPWAALRLIVRGTAIDSETTVETIKGKKFSMGRTLATGGLVRNKKTTTELSSTEQTREGFLHVYAAGHPVSVFHETAVEYTGLGDALQPSRTSNFIVLLELLRASAPQAAYDERLLTRVGQSVLLGPSLNSGGHLRLASALIAASLAGS